MAFLLERSCHSSWNQTCYQVIRTLFIFFFSVEKQTFRDSSFQIRLFYILNMHDLAIFQHTHSSSLTRVPSLLDG